MQQVILYFALSSTFLVLTHGAVTPSSVDKVTGKTKESETWTPVTEPKEFKVNVADGIFGANQVRYEKWDKGTMTGMFSRPAILPGKYEIVNYIADEKGYRITSTKIVTEAELAGIQAGTAVQPDKVHVDILQNGGKIEYSVSKSDIAKPQDSNEKKST